MDHQIVPGDFVIWRGKKYKVRGAMNGEVCIETQNKPLFSDRGGPPEAYAYKCKWLPLSRVHRMKQRVHEAVASWQEKEGAK